MRKKQLNEGLNHIDAEIVEGYLKQKDRLNQKRKTRSAWLRFAVIAACFVLIISAVIIPPMLLEDDSSAPPTVPIWDGAKYSAADVAGLFGSINTDSVATNAYTKIYVPDSKYLYLSEFPDEALLGIYQYNDIQKELDEKALKNFIDGFLPQLAASLGETVPQYKIEEHSYIDESESSLSIYAECGDYRISAWQSEAKNNFTLYKTSSSDRITVLDGETVQIDQRLSDEEIIASLGSIKNKLFEIFGVSFSDTKIIRSFDSYSKHGAQYISIYFYDSDAHPFNSLRNTPVSDYIRIHFDNSLNFSGDIVSDGVLTVADIDYSKNRNNVGEAFQLIANTEIISIEDAEALLYNGYVFGGHSCPLCMAEQEKISFDGYDFVGLEYVFGIDEKTYNPTICIPFYAFYKNIGTSKNGNLIYAKTYVAAIAVSGYKEYFEGQRDEHKNSNEFIEEEPN